MKEEKIIFQFTRAQFITLFSNVSDDIFMAYKALSINKEINENINLMHDRDIYGKNIILLLDELTGKEIIMSLGRLFDNDKSVKSVIKMITIMKSNDYQHPVHLDEAEYAFLEQNNFSYLTEALKSGGFKEFNKMAYLNFQNLLDKQNVRDSIEYIKNLRDKVLAHNQIKYTYQPIDYKMVKILLDLARQIVPFFAFCYAKCFIPHCNGILNVDHALLQGGYIKNFMVESKSKNC